MRRTAYHRSTAAFALMLAAVASACHRAPALDDYGEVPAFSLVDQTGAPIVRADLADRVVIANFIFTRCPTICPTFTAKMQKVGKELAEQEHILLVSFSVDPDYDSPEVLGEFARKFDADPARWKFLTGDPTSIKDRLAAGLQIALEQRGTLPSGGPDIVHGTHFVLIDGRQHIRGYYNSNDPQRVEQLVADARALAR